MPENDPTDPYAGQEAWRHTGAGKHYINRFTGRYGDVQQEVVQGGRVFHLTPRERQMNSEKCKDPANDPFENGTFVKVSLTDETPEADRKRIESNPAMLSDEDIVKLFTGKTPEKLIERVAQISNPVVLQRMLDLAIAGDLPPSRTGAIRSRIVELQGAVGEDGEKRMIPATGEDDPKFAQLYGDSMTGPRTASVGEV